jgi:hypothetical protein
MVNKSNRTRSAPEEFVQQARAQRACQRAGVNFACDGARSAQIIRIPKVKDAWARHPRTDYSDNEKAMRRADCTGAAA